MDRPRLEVARRRLGLCTALMSLAVLLPGFGHAQSTWTGAVNDDFSDGGNWSPAAPGAGDPASISTGTPLVGTSAAVGSLDVSGGVLQVNSDLTASGGTAISDTGRVEVQVGGELVSDVTMTGGSLAVSGTMTGDLSAASGIVVNDGMITGETFIDGAAFTNNGGLGSLTIDSGSAVTNNATGFVMLETDVIDGSLTSNGTLGEVNVREAGIFVNNTGATAGAVANAGTASNAGTIASLDNTGGTFVNGSGGAVTGATAVIGGRVTNNFQMNALDIMAAAMFVNNTGATAGAVTNAGTASNAGTIASLDNTGGTFSNDFGGTVAGATTVSGGTVTNSAAMADVDVASEGSFINNAAGTTGAVANAGTASNDGTVASLTNTGGAFANTGTIAGPATVSGGTLTNDGAVSGTVALYTGGILSGTGSIGGLTVGSGGVVSPGPGFATITVNGDIVFDPGSTYRVDVDPSGLSDQLAATGTVTIDGGTLEVHAGSGTYAPSTPYTILTGSLVTGAFDDVVTDMAFLTPDVTYGPAGVTMELERNGVEFSDVAETANGQATAAAVASLGAADPVFRAALPLDASSANAAFIELSGEIHASLQSASIEEGRLVREAVLDRLDALSKGDLPRRDEPALWSAGFGALTRLDGDGNAAGILSRSSGVLTGFDAPLGDGVSLGGLFGYSESFPGDGVEAAVFHAGLYGLMEAGGLNFSGGAIYSNSRISTRRTVAFGTFSDTLTADYESDMAQVFGQVSTDIAAGDVTLRPFANLAYIHLQTDGFSEEGGPAALASGGGYHDIPMTTLGLRWSAEISSPDLPFTLSGMIGWRHGMGDLAPGLGLAFASGSPFLIEGVTMARDAAVVEAGVSLEFAKNARLRLSYAGEFSAGLATHAARMNVSVDF